mgnify:CR=1 FL=1
MKVISFLNIKGGVAKTISSVNVAAELGRQGYKVLLIDSDPQSNATKYLGLSYPNLQGYYELLSGEDIGISITKYTGVWIIPANINLIASEEEMLKDEENKRTILKDWLNNHDSQFDYVIIDCPPSLGMLSTNALVASDYVLVPIKISQFALDGFKYLYRTIEVIREDLNKNLELLGIFITMDRSTKINREIKQEIKKELGNLLFKQTIRENVDVTKSTFESTPVVYLNKKCNAAKDYKAFVEELKCRII